MREAEYRILVVDDEPGVELPEVELIVRRRTRRDIRSQEYDFIFARDGIEAIDTLSANDESDMVLTDINMPRVDGISLFRKTSEAESGIGSVIISAYGISAHGDMSNIRTAMNHGAFGFLTKPLDFADLRVTIAPHTDGVTEAMDDDGDQFGAHRLREMFADTVQDDAVTATQMVFESVSSFADGAAQSDDIICLTHTEVEFQS